MYEQVMRQALGLHSAGKLAEAGELYAQALRAAPNNFSALSALGFVRLQQRRFADALPYLQAAVAQQPQHFLLWDSLFGAYYGLGRNAEALSCLDRALAIEPGNLQALANRAAVLLELDRPEEALAACDKVLAAEPDNLRVLFNRGVALAKLNRHEESLPIFERVLAAKPDYLDARSNLDNVLYMLGRTSRTPAANLRRTFDRYAPTYDEHMADKLTYRGHVHLRTLFNRLFPKAMPPMRILDLGSGTGLVGEEFKDLVRGEGVRGRLDGIDLSPAMIGAAKKRGIYDNLFLAELEDHLMEEGASYDLVLAADTMVYLGDLSPSLRGVRKRLAPGGHYIFAVEAKGGEGWEMTPARRFRHSLAYMRAGAARAGLEFMEHMDCVIRTDKGVPVPGFTVALRRPR